MRPYYLLPFLLCFGSYAQVARTSLTGSVTDQQGRPIPSARVKAISIATGLKREVETGMQGTYALADLGVGSYLIEIDKEGFATLRLQNVTLEVGHTRTLDVTLGLAERTDQVNVTEAMFQLDRVDATIGAPIEQKQVDELPINGRNWSTLTSLVPGAVDAGAGDQRTIRFVGHGLDDNNLTLDGVDATAVFNQMQREYVRLTIPLESIDQFDVKDQTFGADVEGGTAGAQVAVVSPSGTNSFHGNVFDYFRNDAMEARTPFNGASPNPFLLNQFGGAFGGPIVPNKLFFYAAYEGLRQRLDGTQIGLVPRPGFVAQAGTTSPALLPIVQAYPGGTRPGGCSGWAGMERRSAWSQAPASLRKPVPRRPPCCRSCKPIPAGRRRLPIPTYGPTTRSDAKSTTKTREWSGSIITTPTGRLRSCALTPMRRWRPPQQASSSRRLCGTRSSTTAFSNCCRSSRRGW